MEFELKAIILSPVLECYTLSKQIRTPEENTVTDACVLELIGRNIYIRISPFVREGKCQRARKRWNLSPIGVQCHRNLHLHRVVRLKTYVRRTLRPSTFLPFD